RPPSLVLHLLLRSSRHNDCGFALARHAMLRTGVSDRDCRSTSLPDDASAVLYGVAAGQTSNQRSYSMSLQELRTAPAMGYRHTIEPAPDHVPSEMSRSLVNSATFRTALGQLAAGTSIVTLCDQDGYKLGLTATSVTSVSLDPPLVLVCVGNRTRTAAALKSYAPFIIHFLAAGQESLARHFASPIPDKFAGIAHTMTAIGSPRLEGVLTSIECVPYEIYPGGDH